MPSLPYDLFASFVESKEDISSGNEFTIALGDTIPDLRVYAITLHNPSASTATVTLTSSDGNNTIFVARVGGPGRAHFPIPFIADKGLKFSATGAGATSVWAVVYGT